MLPNMPIRRHRLHYARRSRNKKSLSASKMKDLTLLPKRGLEFFAAFTDRRVLSTEHPVPELACRSSSESLKRIPAAYGSRANRRPAPASSSLCPLTHKEV